MGKAIHGTTLVTNLIIERKGATTGLLTTRNFRVALRSLKGLITTAERAGNQLLALGREPGLINDWKRGDLHRATCTSCNEYLEPLRKGEALH